MKIYNTIDELEQDFEIKIIDNKIHFLFFKNENLKEIFIPGPSISTFIVSSALPIFGLSEEILTMLSTNSK